MSSYFKAIECPYCGEKFNANFIDKSHYFNAVMFASCPKCGFLVINKQFQEFVSRLKCIDEE